MRSPTQRWSLKTKSFALLIGYGAALSAVYLGFSLRLVRSEATLANDQLQATARMVAAEVDAYVQSGRRRLATVAALPGLAFGLRTIRDAGNDGHIPPWTTLHYLFFRSSVFTGGVFLLDHVGNVLWTEPPGMPWLGMNLSQLEPIAAAYNTGSDVVSGALGADVLMSGAHVVVATPVQNSNGETAGILGGVIDLSAPEFAGVLNATSTAQGRFVAVLDAAGRTLAATNGTAPLQPFAPRGAGMARPLLANASLSQAPWRTVAGQPRETAFAATRHSQTVLLISGLALVLLAIAVGVPTVRGFVKSINALTRHAQLMAGGDLSRPVSIGPRQDEIATLAHSFEQMRTELQRSQAALTKRVEEREELVQLKEELLANVSHELRTPLNVIMGYTEMLQESDRGVDQQEVIGGIREQSEHLLTLVSDLMTLSALNTGRVTLKVSRTHPAEVLTRLQPLVVRLRQGRDIGVSWSCAPSLPAIETDSRRLDQILSNLVINAFKFTPQGMVTISADFDAATERLVFRVVDTGIGIPSQEIAYIFDEFRQVDGSMSRVYGGIGLGLALVRKLTTLLQGEISVTSEVDVGSAFSLALPLALGDQAAPADPESGRVAASG